MKYLFDTNALLWAMEKNPLLTEKARKAITDTSNDIDYGVKRHW